jgi:Fur family ferric uptake transcriptional regulator
MLQCLFLQISRNFNIIVAVMDTPSLFQERLRSKGYSLTAPRKLVFETLTKTAHQPLSMTELIQKTKGFADRASVYRAVAALEDAGIVQRLHMGWKHKLELSDDFQEHHHHLSCIKCGQVIHSEEDNELEIRIHRLAQLHGFAITNHQLEIRGLCTECAGRK